MRWREWFCCIGLLIWILELIKLWLSVMIFVYNKFIMWVRVNCVVEDSRYFSSFMDMFCKGIELFYGYSMVYYVDFVLICK